MSFYFVPFVSSGCKPLQVLNLLLFMGVF